jgi:hypothetical protein
MTAADMLSTLNPVSDDVVAGMPVDAAEREMLNAIVATPAASAAEAATPPQSRPPLRSRRSRRPRRALAVAGVVAVILPVLAVLAVLPAGRSGPTTPPSGHSGPSTPSGMPPRPRPAQSSPLILFQLPGWHAWYADEQSTLTGEVDFAPIGAPIRNGAPTRAGAGLTWYDARFARGYIQDRAAEASIKTTARVLGSVAHVIQYKGHVPDGHAYSAIWTIKPRVFEFTMRVRDMAAFKAALTHLRRVDSAAWAKAMPASVVQTGRRSVVIRQMLQGVPLPPGFRASQIPGPQLLRDRYQLGTAVTGTVACEWFARWGQARRNGNRAAVNRAVAAMATARRWPILRQMNAHGGWTGVLVGYAKAMRGGRWFGRPLLPDVDSGLGCSGEWHIKLRAAPLTPTALQPVKSSP